MAEDGIVLKTLDDVDHLHFDTLAGSIFTLQPDGVFQQWAADRVSVEDLIGNSFRLLPTRDERVSLALDTDRKAVANPFASKLFGTPLRGVVVIGLPALLGRDAELPSPCTGDSTICSDDFYRVI